MKIALNFSFFQPRAGGVMEYMRSLLREMVAIEPEHNWIVYVLKDFKDFALENLPPGVDLRLIPFSGGGNIANIRRSIFENKFWLREERREKWDIFHSPFFHSPRLSHTPIVITLHDLRIYRMPETYAFLRRKFLQYKVRESLLRAQKIICVSHFTRSELQECLPEIPIHKSEVILEGIESRNRICREGSNLLPEFLTAKKYILAVGRLEPRKNYPLMIEGFLEARKRSDYLKDCKLVIVGGKDHHYQPTLDIIERNRDCIAYYDFVSPELLLTLYSNAGLHIQASYYEGFGFTPLEAASRGVATIAAQAGSLPEICGEGAIYFNPFSREDLTDAILRGIQYMIDGNELINKIPMERYEWRKSAQSTLQIYSNISGRNSD